MIDLKERYEKKFKVTSEGIVDGRLKSLFYEIKGKRGYIRPYGNALELYVSNKRVAARIERSFAQFKPKNHYDDATAFTFSEEYLSLACRLIKAKKRRIMSPEQLLRLATMRSLIKKPLVAVGLAGGSARSGV